MKIFSFLTGFIEPLTKVVDDLHTSQEEKGALKMRLYELQSALTAKVLEYESKLAETQASVVRAEAEGQSWLQRNWRPILMLTFTYIIAHNFVVSPLFGVERVEIPPDMWTLLQVGMGGYIAFRSMEKVAPKVAETITKGRKGDFS